uniref:Uncharacterized protein n=1 Tax=Eutreptiella gymnastica TaxID=73025 RepID=A0A6U8MSN4_9EUGL
MAEDDQKALERVLKNADLRSALEDLWVCILKDGEPLFEGRMDEEAFLQFVKSAGFVRKGLQAHDDIQQYTHRFQAVASEHSHLDFTAFVRAIFHAAMYCHNTTERIPALKVLLDRYGNRYARAVYEANEHDGITASPVLAEALRPDGPVSIELDQLFYQYRRVLTRLFNKYKGAHSHKQKDLPPEDVEAMQTTIEAEDMRELLKDLNLFPNAITLLDICRIVHFSVYETEPAFGSDNLELSGEGPDSVADLSKGTEAALHDATRLVEKSEADRILNALRMASDSTSDVYFVGPTPQLDRSQFVDALIRVAQHLYKDDKRLPTFLSRVQKLFRHIEPFYDKSFGSLLQSDLQLDRQGVPVLLQVCPTKGSCNAEFELELIGSNFDVGSDNGINVKLSDGGSEWVVKTQSTEANKVTIIVPCIQPTNTCVELLKDDGGLSYEVVRQIHLTVSASNDRLIYSANDPPLVLLLEKPTIRLTVPNDLVDRLSRSFHEHCKSEDGYNSIGMNREQWRQFKKAHKLEETLRHSATSAEEDPYFDELTSAAGLHQKSKDAPRELGWEAFVEVLIKIAAQECNLGAAGLLQWLRQMLQSARSVGGPHQHTTDSDEELRKAKAGIKLVQRGTTRTLDIYCGPVLCGTVQERPGLISSLRSQHKDRHKFLTYTQHDINTEARIRAHISTAESFDHLLSRLMLDCFELAASCDPTTRKPTGRCWTIHHGKQKIGALWDYKGQMSNLDWQPAQVESTNNPVTLAVYRPDSDLHYVNCYLCFSKSKDVSHMRSMLTSKGYLLQTLLYKL